LTAAGHAGNRIETHAGDFAQDYQQLWNYSKAADGRYIVRNVLRAIGHEKTSSRRTASNLPGLCALLSQLILAV
jgi:hypothetical protein